MRQSLILCMLIILSGMVFGEDKERILYESGGRQELGKVTGSEAKVLIGKTSFKVRTEGPSERWPGVTIKAPAASGKWDLSKYEWLAVDVANTGSKSVTFNCRVDNPGADGRENCITGNTEIEAGRTGSITVRFHKTPWVLSEPMELIGMRGNPEHQGKLDTSNVTQILVFVSQPKQRHAFEIKRIVAGGSITMLDSKNFIPFIDEYGQLIHSDWPGKVHSPGEFEDRKKTEAQDIADHPGPENWNKYGGWTGGPKLKATGYFRVQKYKDKWWMVDPEGRLFWSHGIDCVREGNDTPITDRDNYFVKLPDEGTAFAAFYGRGTWAPHGYYKDHSPYRTYDFSRANFLRKYGSNWEDEFADITHRRLRSWGMNTIANWSQSSIYLMRRTPYTGTISFGSRVIEGSEGYWGKFYDVFDESFRANLKNALAAHKDKAIGDPWCFGFFVHNEIAWGQELALAISALKSPANQPAKLVFIEDLKAKYKTIGKLNSVWGTKHESWEALTKSTDSPDQEKAKDDLQAFNEKIADTYFKTIRDEFKAVAPDQLYMGCRFAWVNDTAAKAAAEYCDIVCYNRYAYSVAEHKLPGEIDMPIIVGEFHFGALDRGMFHTGLKPTKNQDDRAVKYTEYVQGALRNRYIVGTHWFQYKDQATTGRGDGENYQIGFVDICDTPYPETIKASRDVGYNMYEYRLK